MREILFRGKSVNDGRWVFGDLSNYGDCKTITTVKDFTIIDSCEVIPETVGQYTGLTDKNGKKVFSGDILRVKHCEGTGSRIYPVYFGRYIDADSVFANYHCIGYYVKASDVCCTIGALLSEGFEFEVIGNVYDNQELLEEET